MFNLILGVAMGLIVGWVFLPEPQFVRDFFVRAGVAARAEMTKVRAKL